MMRRLRTRLSPRLRDDSGVTLAELIVVMMLSTLLLALAGQLFVSVARHTVTAEDLRMSTADASNIMNVLSTTIRASVNNGVAGRSTPDAAVVSATGASIVVTSYSDAGPSFPDPQRLRYTIDGQGRMIEERWAPNVSTGYAVFPSLGTEPDSRRVLGNVVINAEDDPVFRYYNPLGVELVPITTGLTAAQRGQVAAVAITVKVRADNSHEVITLENTVGMPNLQYQREMEED